MNKVCFNLSFIFLISVNCFSQVQVGQKLEGIKGSDVYSDEFGYSVSISANGDIIAIGAPENDTNGHSSGHVRIYENNQGTWTKIGSDIEGDFNGNKLGTAVSISSTGNLVAIGAPGYSGANAESGMVRIYSNVNNTWTPLGNDMYGKPLIGNQIAERFGTTVSLSADGNTVAVGMPTNSTIGLFQGIVRVYQNVSGVWTQAGQDIVGEKVQDYSGGSIALSNNGSTLAVGAYANDGNGTTSGHVRVYENIQGVWTQIGADINGDAAYSEAGRGVDLSADGKIVAVGAPGTNANGANSGRVRIYENVQGIWTQIGQGIDGLAMGDRFGAQVALSADGSTVVVSGLNNLSLSTSKGHLRVYRNISGVWTQAGTQVDGDANYDLFGSSIDCSADGKTVIAGAIQKLVSPMLGYAKVYDFSQALNAEQFVKIDFSVYPNPAYNLLNIVLDDKMFLQNVFIYDVTGKVVKKTEQNIIDVHNLNNGIYFVEIHTNLGKAVKTIIKK